MVLNNTQELSFSIDKSDFCVVEVVALYENNMTSVGVIDIYSSEFGVPQNVTAIDNISSILVTWDAVDKAISYDVYRNKKFMANVNTTSYVDGDFLKGDKCCYQVKAVFENNKSVLSKETCIVATADMIEEVNSKLEIYPNPANDRLFIEAEIEIENVVVYDIYGRSQQSTVNGQQSLSIDLSKLNAGIYFIKINTEEGNIVKRIIKK